MSNWQWKERSELDINRFDEAVSKNSRSIYARSFYLDAVAKNWGSYTIDDYEDVLPVAYTNYLGIRKAYVPNFAAASFSVFDETTLSEFQTLIAKHWKYYDLHLLTPLQNWQNGRGYQWIDLKEHDLADYSNNAKRQIKKAEKNNFQIEISQQHHAVLELFKKYTAPKIDALQNSDIDSFANLLDALEQRNQLICYSIAAEDEIQGGGFYVISGDTLIYLKGSAAAHVMKNGGMYAMMHHAISSYKNDLSYFDFGGSAVPSVAEFNRKLNAQNAKTVSLQSQELPLWYRAIRKMYRRIKK